VMPYIYPTSRKQIMIRGKQIGLRAIEESDLASMRSWRNNPSLRKYFREYREINVIQQKAWFEHISKQASNTLMFAIVDLESNALLGAGGLCYISLIHRNAEISLYIGKDNLYIDEAVAPDAARTILQYGFDEVGLQRIWTEVYSFDTPKQKLLRSLHFTHEGVKRSAYWLHGQWHDSLIYGLLASEFKKNE